MTSSTQFLLGTRKGLLVFSQEKGDWTQTGEHFPGVPVSYACADPRNGSWWACLDHGHWGVKLHRSKDQGKSWEEIPAPAYPEGSEIKPGEPASNTYMWVLQPGAASEPHTLYIGTEPGGLFRSDDGGDTWNLIEGLWNHPSRDENWYGGGRDHPGIHSIIVDEQDPSHLYVGISCAGVFESKDRGETWHPANKGLKATYLPDPDVEVGHDPHLVVASPVNPQVMWQQNHCGIFRSEDGSASWEAVSREGDNTHFGFVISASPKDPQTAFVLPAKSDMHRLTIERRLFVSRTRDGGKTWQELDKGLPKGAYDIVYRHAMDISGETLAFGTTTGNLFLSNDEGEHWNCLSNYLPLVYSLRFIPA